MIEIENVNPDVFPSLSFNSWQLFGSLSLPFPFLSVKPLTSPRRFLHTNTRKLDRQSGENHETDNLAKYPVFPSSASLLAVVSRSSLLWDDDQRVTMMNDVGKGGGQDTRGRRTQPRGE